MAEKNVGLRKRQQIENTAKTMFLWVVIASVVVAIAAVVSFSLIERLMFNNRVIGLKSETASNLENNNKIVDTLRQNIRVMNTNQDLLDTPRLDGTEPLSVVLDALPSRANSSALGASLQTKLLTGVSIDSLVVDPTSEENGGTSATADNEISFSFTVSAPAKDRNKIKAVLRNLERSIRTITIQSASIEQRSSTISLSVKGVAYYSPEAQVELKTKPLRPSDKAE